MTQANPNSNCPADYAEEIGHGYGDTDLRFTGEVDDSLSTLGDDITLEGFMKREDELLAAIEAETDIARQKQLINQIVRLQNTYDQLRTQSIDARHIRRLGRMPLHRASENE